MEDQFYSEAQTERKYAVFADVDIYYMTKKQHININIYQYSLDEMLSFIIKAL